MHSGCKESNQFTRWIKEANENRKQPANMKRDEGQFYMSHVVYEFLVANAKTSTNVSFIGLDIRTISLMNGDIFTTQNSYHIDLRPRRPNTGLCHHIQRGL